MSEHGSRREDLHVSHLQRRGLGHRGQAIPNHRALRRLHLDPWGQGSALVVAFALTLTWTWAMPSVAALWASICRFTLEVLGRPASVLVVQLGQWGPFEIVAPRIGLYAGTPDPLQWSVGLGITAVMLGGSVFLTGRLLPLAYALRLLSILQISSQLVFALVPEAFPYEVAGYTEVLFVANLFLIGLVPLVLALTYAPLDFRLRHRIALPLLVMAHLLIFVPLQYTAHAVVMNEGSLLWMPLLFWAFGLTVDVTIVVALYGWGVSWSTRPDRPLPRPRRRRRQVEFALLLILGGGMVRADAASAQTYRWSASAGLEIGRYTDGLGDSDAQSLALTHERAWVDRWRLDLGRAARFGDEGLGLGVGYFRHLRRDTVVSAGLGTGTGDVIFPRWRFDAGLRYTGLADGRLLLDVGYTHVQSKSENSSDGVGAGVFWYLRGPWSVGIDARVDVGQPGSDVAHNVGASLNFGLHRRLYAFVRGETGRVAYTLVGPSDALVEYDSRGARAGVTWYVRDDRGVAFEGSVLDTEFYVLRAATLRVFREW